MNPTVEAIIRDYQRQIASLHAENEQLRKRLAEADRRDAWTQGLVRQMVKKRQMVEGRS